MRKAMVLANVTLYVKQYDDADGKNHIDIEQVVIGGIKGTTEKRTLDNEPSKEAHEDHIFGKVTGYNRFAKWSEFKDDDPDDAFLKEGWTQDTYDLGETVLAAADSVTNGWKSKMTWGFRIIDGERKYARAIIVSNNGKTIRIHTAYDYKGELPDEYKNKDF